MNNHAGAVITQFNIHRSLLAVYVQAFNYWLKIPEDKKAAIQVVTQMLHNASLL